MVSVSFRCDLASGMYWGGVGQGQIFGNSRPSVNAASIAVQERFNASISPVEVSDKALMTWPVWKSAPNGQFAFPLGWILIAAIVLPVTIYLTIWRRMSRRHRLGLCLSCGYDLRESGLICPECATPRDLLLPLRWPISIVPSAKSVARVIAIASALFSLIIIALAIVFWSIGRADRLAQERYKLAGVDVTRFVLATAPHLSGDVVDLAGLTRISPADLAPGNLLLLGDGTYSISFRDSSRNLAQRPFRDLAIVGKSPEKTRLRLNLNNATRLRLENVTIDCGDDPCFDLREDGSVSLKNCMIINYNSGAGGSSGIDGSNTTLMIEDCTFDGSGGRQLGRSFGNAFDLRGANQVYARNSTFVDNAEISREACITYDGCTRRMSSGRAAPPYGDGAHFLRNSPTLISSPRSPGQTETFAEAMDDPAFVQRVLHGAATADALTQRLLDSRDLLSDARYWLGLYNNPQDEIRAIAAAQLSRLNYAPAKSCAGWHGSIAGAYTASGKPQAG